MRAFLRTVAADIWRGLVTVVRHPIRSAVAIIDGVSQLCDDLADTTR